VRWPLIITYINIHNLGVGNVQPHSFPTDMKGCCCCENTPAGWPHSQYSSPLTEWWVNQMGPLQNNTTIYHSETHFVCRRLLRRCCQNHRHMLDRTSHQNDTGRRQTKVQGQGELNTIKRNKNSEFYVNKTSLKIAKVGLYSKYI